MASVAPQSSTATIASDVRLDPASLQQMYAQNEAQVLRLQKELEILASVRSRFETSREALKATHEVPNGNKLFVPFSDSVFQDGSLKDNNTFFVDVGAGYVVQKDYASAAEYFTKRLRAIEENIAIIAKDLGEARKLQQLLKAQLQRHIAAASASRQGGAAVAAQ